MKKISLIFILLILVLGGGGVYYYFFKSPAKQPVTSAEVASVLKKLERHIILPTDEQPEIGRIDDPIEAVKNQPFVTGAQKGDLLIVYVKARRAIVYSPSRDIIVNVGPISFDSRTTENQAVSEIKVGTSTPNE